MADGQAEHILEEAQKRCEAAELFDQEGESRSVSFEDNKLKRITARQYRGCGLRVIKEGRVGFASTTDFGRPHKLVEMALESASFGDEDRFEFPSQPESLPEVECMDARVSQVEAEQMVELGREGLERSQHTNEEYMFGADVSQQITHMRILNSSGLDLGWSESQMAGMVAIQHVSEDGLLQVYEVTSSGQPLDTMMDLTKTALQKMEQASKVTPVKMEVMPIVFAPKAAKTLIAPILMAVSGKRVYKGSSVLRGRLGESLFDEKLTILDDPTVSYAPATQPADCEGVPVQPLPVVEKGKLKNFLFDLQTAGLMDTDTTGHGSRSYDSQPSPGSSNVVVSAGTESLEHIRESADKAVIVDQTLGGGQSNMLAGEFSVNVALGFLVQNGRIQGRIKDCMVAGNAYEALSQIEAITSDREWVGSSLLPAIQVKDLKLAAAQ